MRYLLTENAMEGDPHVQGVLGNHNSSLHSKLGQLLFSHSVIPPLLLLLLLNNEYNIII